MFSLVLLCALVTPSAAIIGYDCGSPSANVTTFSILEQPPCEDENVQAKTGIVDIQLLQLADFNNAPVLQCKVEIDRTIYHCGMHSHISIVHNGRQQYIHTTTRDVCQTLQSSGNLFLSPAIQISGIAPNSTATRSVTLAGTLQSNGACTGETYSDPYGTWTGVVVQAIVRITIRNTIAPVKFTTNQIHLPSGQHCPLQPGSCLDSEDGFSYWDPLPADSCQFNRYEVLYEGRATRIFNEAGSGTSVFTVTSGDVAFALTETRRTSTCGYTLIRTEHPKLLILDTANGKFKSRVNTQINNLDIFTYVNTKFVYVEKHFRTQLINLYKDITRQRCELEQQVLRNALTLINTAPEEVAATIAKGPGHMAIQSGEAVHIVKCIPVTCTLRKTNECFNELPVTFRNSSFFLTPKNHILVKVGTQKDCSQLAPALFKIHGAWYRMSPNPVESIPPQSPKLLSGASWKYVSPKNLANSGIYSNEDLAKLRDHIMFPAEKAIVINSIAQGATGRKFTPNQLSISGLLDEESLERIAASTGRKIWSAFTSFGSFTAGILGLYIIVRLIKFAINIILNGIALHSVYGWSVHLLAAVWSALTYFCINLKKETDEPNSEVHRECVPMNDTNIDIKTLRCASVSERSQSRGNEPQSSADSFLYAMPLHNPATCKRFKADSSNLPGKDEDNFSPKIVSLGGEV